MKDLIFKNYIYLYRFLFFCFFFQILELFFFLDPMERFRKYDPADRSFIRFGRSADQATKQIKSKFLKQYFNYMKRPAGGDRSFLRFGRSVN